MATKLTDEELVQEIVKEINHRWREWQESDEQPNPLNVYLLSALRLWKNSNGN